MTQTSQFLSLLLLIVIPRCLGAEWGVTYSPTHICAPEGSSVTMSCSYTYPSDLTVKEAFWINKNKEVPVDLTTKTDYTERVKVDCGDKTRQCYLTITGVTKEDAQHRYYCRITTNNKTEKWIGTPGVEVHLTDLHISSSKGTEVKEGDHVNLTCGNTCPLSTNPAFTWSKYGRPVEKKQITKNQLQLHPVSYEDEGSYTCAVRGHEGHPSPPYRLHVMYPPKNTRVVSAPSGEITEGTRVTLTCMSEADPPVHTYTWIKKRGAVELESGKENTLTFSKIRSEDSGQYLCRAVNMIGQQDSLALLIKVSSVGHDQTILIAVLVGVAVTAVVGLLCIICRWRRSKQLATNNTRTSGEDDQDDDVQYSSINFQRSGQSRAAGPPSGADAAGGAEDDVQYSTIQPHGSTQAAGAQEDDVLYASVQPKRSTQTAGAQGDDVQYASVQFKKAGGAKSSPDQPEGERSVIYSSVQKRP
ncbi:B-cell receptor CD22-like [Alosa pseudoharengus]|uniref:B-cell receptor CD22-like n=1 Tax=Alosa pseudoharengus TaxID=34774 RepID=UPI003F88817F